MKCTRCKKRTGILLGTFRAFISETMCKGYTLRLCPKCSIVCIKSLLDSSQIGDYTLFMSKNAKEL